MRSSLVFASALWFAAITTGPVSGIKITSQIAVEHLDYDDELLFLAHGNTEDAKPKVAAVDKAAPVPGAKASKGEAAGKKPASGAGAAKKGTKPEPKAGASK